MKKILFLITQDLESPSGLGRYLPMAREMVALGFSISIAALHSNYDSLRTKRFRLDGVEINYVAQMHVIKKGNQKQYYSSVRLLFITLNAFLKLLIAALTTPADIIYIGKPHPMNSLSGLLMKYIFRKTVYLDCDDYEIGVNHFQNVLQQKIVSFFEQVIPQLVDYITTNTYFTRSRLLAMGIPATKIFYLPNGVDRQRFQAIELDLIEKIRSDLGLERKRVVAYIGTIGLSAHPINLLLEAFVKVASAVPNSILLLVGGGEDYSKMKLEACRLGIDNKVLMTGRIPSEKVGIYYKIAHVSIDPVYADNAAKGRSPLKMLESWVSEVPFITSNVGDRTLLAGNPPAALFAKPGDADSLAEAIIRVLSSEKLSAELVRLGRERVEQLFWDRIMANCQKIFTKDDFDNKGL
ncbi:MAG: glycosyltransferase family 4 protein [Candidatus Atribacteria bacterium]|nr:glycosyltransferase family 4 protein [Candidatus Atribacteria bacterium]